MSRKGNLAIAFSRSEEEAGFLLSCSLGSVVMSRDIEALESSRSHILSDSKAH
jgi:hypothetical protein